MIFGKAKRANAIQKALMKRINKADCVGEELEINGKVAKGLSRKNHAISIRSYENGVKLFENKINSYKSILILRLTACFLNILIYRTRKI